MKDVLSKCKVMVRLLQGEIYLGIEEPCGLALDSHTSLFYFTHLRRKSKSSKKPTIFTLKISCLKTIVQLTLCLCKKQKSSHAYRTVNQSNFTVRTKRSLSTWLDELKLHSTRERCWSLPASLCTLKVKNWWEGDIYSQSFKTNVVWKAPRWRRSRMGKTLSPPQIHQKSI